VANQWLAFGTFVGNIVDAGGLSKTKKNPTDISWLVLLNGLLGGGAAFFFLSEQQCANKRMRAQSKP